MEQAPFITNTFLIPILEEDSKELWKTMHLLAWSNIPNYRIRSGSPQLVAYILRPFFFVLVFYTCLFLFHLIFLPVDKMFKYLFGYGLACTVFSNVCSLFQIGKGHPPLMLTENLAKLCSWRLMKGCSPVTKNTLDKSWDGVMVRELEILSQIFPQP